MVTLGKGIWNKVNKDGYTGRLAEEEVVPPCCADCRGCKSDFDILKKIIESQPPGWNPTDPKPIIANNIHASVSIALGLKDWSELEFYTALYTALDRRGIDCFLKLGDHFLTIDLTVNIQKGKHKADFVFNVNFDTEEAMLMSFGKRVAEMFKSGRAKLYNYGLVL